MAVDGNMYVLFADGTIQKYLAGEPQPFSMRGLPDAMDSPRAIFVSGPQEPDAPGFVYVADTGNQRILQFDKQGTFLRQFRASAGQQVLRDLQGLYVDEDTGRLFIVSGRTLLLTAFTPYPTS
jgi:sugar lactone lactonase YvrE